MAAPLAELSNLIAPWALPRSRSVKVCRTSPSCSLLNKNSLGRIFLKKNERAPCPSVCRASLKALRGVRACQDFVWDWLRRSESSQCTTWCDLKSPQPVPLLSESTFSWGLPNHTCCSWKQPRSEPTAHMNHWPADHSRCRV